MVARATRSGVSLIGGITRGGLPLSLLFSAITFTPHKIRPPLSLGSCLGRIDVPVTENGLLGDTPLSHIPTKQDKHK